MDTSRIMGLDVGDRRIGIALSDVLKITAQGKETYNRSDSDETDSEYIANLVKQNNVSLVVCGLPKNMDGTIGAQANKVMEFADIIKAKANVEIAYVDERLTTVSANRMLYDADVHWSKRKKIVDKIAAVYILQTYLDSNN